MAYSLDVWEAFIRLIKYLLEGLAVAFVAYILPKTQLRFDEILFIALTAAAVFSILDLLAPAYSTGARQGVGLGAGFQLVGFPAGFR
jgi:hypothetical protein